MTAQDLLNHLFPWEIAPGIPRDDDGLKAADAAKAA